MPILFGVILLDLIGFGIVIPILPFLSPTLGADKMDIALIIASYAVCAGICGPWWGRLSDRIGRKPVIMLCLGGGALSYVMLGLASSLWMVYAARAWAGLMAGNLGVASAMIADITPPERRARGMGLVGTAFGLGIVLGPMLGGVLSGHEPGFTLPCLVAGLMSTLAILAAALFLPESLTAERRRVTGEEQRASAGRSTYTLLRDSGNRLLVFQFVLHSLCVSSLTYLFPLWSGDLLGWSARQVGIVFGVQGALMVLFQGGLLGPLVRVLGEWRLLCIAIAALATGLASAAFAGSAPFMVGSMFVAMTGATLCIPLLNSILSRRSAEAWRGRLLGTSGAAAAWGRVCGPVLAGSNLALFGYRGAWLGTLLFALAYLGWALRQYAGRARQSTA